MSAPRSPGPEADQEFETRSRRRSVDMYEAMEERDWVEDIRMIDDEPYLMIDGTPYRILDSGVTEFDNSDKPLVSVGARLSRELIILDPESEYLQKLYQTLKAEIEKLDERDQDIQGVLNHTIDFVKYHLRPELGQLTAEVDRLRKNPKNYMESDDGEPIEYRGKPVILLDTFVRQNVGVCRHHALLTAYFIHNLVLDGLLPFGHVFSHRDTVLSGGAHVWTIYKPVQPVHTNNDYDFYLVDSLWNKAAYNLRDCSQYFMKKGYGEQAIKYCIDRHNKPDIETVAYTKIDGRNPRLKENFIYDLLDVSPERRRKFLNQQHSLGACETILRDLTSIHRFSRHPNYDVLVDDLERVLNSEELHRRNYAYVKGDDARQQFVLSLLCKLEDARSEVLEKQNVEDLRQLKNSLEFDSVDRKDLYEQFPAYTTLLSEIQNRIDIELKDLLEQHYDRITDSDTKLRFAMEIVCCRPGLRNSFLDKQNLQDLDHLKQSLTHRKDLYVAEHNQEFKSLLRELNERIALKNSMHTTHYHVIKSRDVRRDFLRELMQCAPEERRKILDKQDRADLKHLQKSLSTTEGYEEMPAYNSVMREIDRQMLVSSFDLLKSIILSGRLEVTTTGFITNFWTPGKKIAISADESIQIPTCAEDVLPDFI